MKIDADPYKQWCPKPGCTKHIGLKQIIKKKTLLKCECGHEFCGNCTEPWHPKKSCKKASKLKSYINKKKS